MTDIIQAFREGKKIRSKKWVKDFSINLEDQEIICHGNFFVDDDIWKDIFIYPERFELYQEPQQSEFEKWLDSHIVEEILKVYMRQSFQKAIEVLEEHWNKGGDKTDPISVEVLKDFLGEK